MFTRTPAAEYQLTPETGERYSAYVGGLAATRGITESWTRLTVGSLSASRMSGLLAAHDEALIGFWNETVGPDDEVRVTDWQLGVLGGVLGLGLAYVGLRVLLAIGSSDLPRLTEISLDRVVVAFAVIISLASGLLFGLIPIVKYATPRLASALAGGRQA